MASIEGSFDPDDPYKSIVVIKQAADTLPDHIKGNVFWAPAGHTVDPQVITSKTNRLMTTFQ